MNVWQEARIAQQIRAFQEQERLARTLGPSPTKLSGEEQEVVNAALNFERRAYNYYKTKRAQRELRTTVCGLTFNVQRLGLRILIAELALQLLAGPALMLLGYAQGNMVGFGVGVMALVFGLVFAPPVIGLLFFGTMIDKKNEQRLAREWEEILTKSTEVWGLSGPRTLVVSLGLGGWKNFCSEDQLPGVAPTASLLPPDSSQPIDQDPSR